MSNTEANRVHAHDVDPFQLADLDIVARVIEQFSGSCLDAMQASSSLLPTDQFASNSQLFSGGSAPRDVWVRSGLGATVDATEASTGRRFDLIDLCSMTANTVLGINDPWVKLKQAAYLTSSYPHYLTARFGHDLSFRIARRILDRFEAFGGAGAFAVNLRQCNGSDAVELALHAAWRAAVPEPKRRRLATFRGSYHGESLTANWVSDHQPGRLLAETPGNVDFFPAPEIGADGELTSETLATLDALDADGASYFSVIVEPIQWRNSVHVVPIEFLRQLREICTRRSICLVFDEMQNAFGYVGTVTYAEKFGVCPDISAMSKALTSGHGSLAVIVARRAFAQIETPFGAKSNSGNMLALVAADAVLDRLLGLEASDRAAIPDWIPAGLAAELKTGMLPARYDAAAARLDAMLIDLKVRFPSLVGDLRGIGLVRGVVILDARGQPSAELAALAAKICLVRGVYVRQADTAMLVKPAMVLSDREVDIATVALVDTFREVLAVRDG